MIVRLYIKQPLLNDICKNKSIMVIYMCFIYTKDFRGIVIGKLLFVEISIFLKSRKYILSIGDLRADCKSISVSLRKILTSNGYHSRGQDADV